MADTWTGTAPNTFLDRASAGLADVSAGAKFQEWAGTWKGPAGHVRDESASVFDGLPDIVKRLPIARLLAALADIVSDEGERALVAARPAALKVLEGPGTLQEATEAIMTLASGLDAAGLDGERVPALPPRPRKAKPVIPGKPTPVPTPVPTPRKGRGGTGLLLGALAAAVAIAALR